MTQALKRGLFGYRASAVRQVLADHETMFQRAVEDTRETESRLGQTNAELDAAREEARSIRADLAEREHELESVLRRVAELEIELQDAHKQAGEIDTKLQDARRRAEATEAELEGATRRATQLATELQEARSGAVDLEAEITRLRESERAQMEKGRASDTELDNLRTEIGVLRRLVHNRETAAAEREAMITERDEVIADLRAHVERREFDLGASELSIEPATPLASPADLDRILAQTGEQIAKMVEDARRTAEREFAETERHRDRVRAEVDRLEAWRDRIVPLARDVRVLLTETDTQTDAIDKRLREAIDPMTRSIASLQNRLRELVAQAGELDPDPGTGTGTEPAAFGDDDPSAPGSEGDGVVRRWMP